MSCSAQVRIWKTTLAGILVCAASAAGQSPDTRQKAQQAYVAGARMLERKELAGAQEAFLRAASLDPARSEYSLAATLTREHRISDLVQRAAQARMTNRPALADTLLADARTIDPTNDLVVEHLAAVSAWTAQGAAADGRAVLPVRTEYTHEREIAFRPPAELQPQTVRKDFALYGDPRQIVPQVGMLFGLKVVFDDSANQPSKPMRFELERASYEEAMPLLLRMSHLFAVPIDSGTLLVAKDTQENRQRLERLVEETIYVPGSTIEQLNELSNIVKSVFDVKQVFVGQSSGTIIVRAPDATLKVVNETISDLVDGGAEVVLELKLLSIDTSASRNIGTVTPTSLGAFSVAAEAQSIVSANQALVNQLISSGGYVPQGNANDVIFEALLLVLSGAVQDAKVAGLIALAGHGLSLTGLYTSSGITANLALNTSDVRALDDLTVRAGDRQTTTLRVGEKYPITTATYSSGISSATSSALAGVKINGVSASSLLNQYLGSGANSTVPQVQFEDLGITLKTTPRVLKSGLVSLHIDLKIESLTGASANNIPVLTSRAFTSDIMVPDGSSAMMLSDLSKSEAASLSGIPGLAELPGLQETAADKLRETASSELVLLVTPHVVRHRPEISASRRIPFVPTVPQDY